MRRVILLIFIIAAAVPVFAESSVWKLSEGTNTLYLAGTVHLMRETDYPLPPEYDYAYERAGTIIFETDIGSLTDPDTAVKMLDQGMYTGGESLKSVLSPDVYRVLVKVVEESGFTMESLNTFKPGMLASVLATTAWQEELFTAEGIDSHYYYRAVHDGKRIRYLESIDIQIEAITNMGAGHEDEFILYILDEQNTSGDELTGLIDDWRTGGSMRMEEALLELQSSFPETYREIVADRNTRWLKRMKKYLKSSETELILFGSLHLYGKDGILNQLRNEGYSLEQLKLQ